MDNRKIISSSLLAVDAKRSMKFYLDCYITESGRILDELWLKVFLKSIVLFYHLGKINLICPLPKIESNKREEIQPSKENKSQSVQNASFVLTYFLQDLWSVLIRTILSLLHGRKNARSTTNIRKSLAEWLAFKEYLWRRRIW